MRVVTDMHRRLSMLLPIVLLSSCAYGDIAEAPDPDPTLTTQARAVAESLDQIGNVFDDVESEDLAMAWTDLDADLRSVVEDLVRDPESIDMEGMQARLEGFMTRFQSETAMTRINGEWDHLMTGLDELASRPRLMLSP